MFGGDQRLVDEGRTRIRDGGYFVLGTILAMEVPTDKGRYIRKCVQSEVRLRRGELEVSMSGTIACYGGAHIKFLVVVYASRSTKQRRQLLGRSSKQRNVVPS